MIAPTLRRRLLLVLCSLALIWMGSAIPAALAADDPGRGASFEHDVGPAALDQELIPAWTARRLAAIARVEGLQALLDGERSWREATADLDIATLNEPVVIEGRLRALDRAAERRALDRARLRALPADGPLTTKLRSALGSTLDAEASAADLERRVLLGLRGWLRRAPWATADGLERLLAPWTSEIAVARAEVAERDSAEGGQEVDPEAEGAPSTAAGAAGSPPGPAERARRADLERSAILAVVDQIRDAAALGIGSLPDPASDLALLASGDPSRAAVLRLAMLAAELPPPDAAPLIAQIASATSDDSPALEPASRKADQITALEVAPPAYRSVLDASIAAGQGDLADVEESQADATATRSEADLVRRSEEATASLTARLIEGRVPAEERVASLTADLAHRSDTEHEAYEAARAQLAEARALAEEATSRRSAADRDEIDRVYRQLPRLLAELRDRARGLDVALAGYQREDVEASRRIEAERARIREERRALASVADPQVRARRALALDRWSDVLDAEAALIRQRIEELEQARDRNLGLIPEVAAGRTALWRWVSAEVRSEDRAMALREAADELLMVGPTYLASVRVRWLTFQEDPWWFLNLRMLSSLALGSLSLLVGLAVWLVVRRYTRGLALLLTRYLERVRSIGLLELASARPLVARVLRTAVDVLGALLLVRFVPPDLPELSVALLFFFEIQLIRLELSIFDLFIARRPALRPAVARLASPAWRIARLTVLGLGLWLALRRVALAFAQDLLAGFATEYLVRLATGWMLAVLLMVLLYAWAPHLRGEVARLARDGWVRRLFGTAPPTVLLNGLQAIGGVVVLSYFMARRLIYLLVRHGAGSRWISALDLLRFGRASADDSERERRPLEDQVVERLVAVATTSVYVERPKVRDALLKELREWRDDDRQGLIALLGDAGEGVDTALDHWSTAWEDEGFTARRVRIGQRLLLREDALAWLAEVFELPSVPDDVDEAAALLDAHLEPGLILVDRLNHAFLRRVGGFEALRTLLEVFHADGLKRCYILAFYRPSWKYLERLGSTVNVHLVRAVHDLAPLTAAALRELTEKIVHQAEMTLDFDSLMRSGALAATPEEEREQAIEAFYRLLATHSSGNPSIAVKLWLSCLEIHEPGVLRVRVSDALRGNHLPELIDDQLFVLAALRTHRTLTEAELSEVLNMGPTQVRALVRQMIALDLLVRRGGNLCIDRHRLPSVTALLRRRHFLHWS